MSNKKYNGKIGYCTDKALGIFTRNSTGGHYVYVRSDEGDKCTVSVVTSLEDSNNNLVNKKIGKIRKGWVYPIPKEDANFTRWSGVDNRLKEIDKKLIYDIDKKKIKHKHKLVIDKVWK